MIVNFKIVDNLLYGEFENEMYLWGKICGKTIRWSQFANSQLSQETKKFIRGCVFHNC